MTRILFAAALLAGAPSIASAETAASGGGPAGGAFMSTYASQAPRLEQRAAPRAEFAQGRATTDDVSATGSTRPRMQRRAR